MLVIAILQICRIIAPINHSKQVLKMTKTTILINILLFCMGLTIATSGQAQGHYRSHHCYQCGGSDFGPGLAVGSVFGFLAGAAVTSHAGYYHHPHYRRRHHCRRVIWRCRYFHGRYGPVKRCRRIVRWVC